MSRQESNKLIAIEGEVTRAVKALLDVGGFKPGQLLVVGCSTSEILGNRIGSSGNIEVAEAVLDGLFRGLSGSGLNLAVQCCEHLNRALVVERPVAETYGLTEVQVMPVPEAGGSAATAAYRRFGDPLVVETVRGHGGIDIGDTFIGMHLVPVVVPVRVDAPHVGQAHLTLARTRPKLIGGKRAVYP